MEAMFFEKRPGGRVKCLLCPRGCNIPPGKQGFCFVRANRGGTMVNEAYARPTAVHVDPIEKKPLFHFLPGSRVLSVGSAGCNMGCRFCQNWDLSRARDSQAGAVHLPPVELVRAARKFGCPSIAFTYNEPTILAEYVMDTAALAAGKGVRTVMVTNGYISKDAIRHVYRDVDAANVDLKAFSDRFYRKQTYSRLGPVLDALLGIKAMGTWIEITTLLIPGLNDGDDEIRREARWIAENLGTEVPLHFSAFHPAYRMTDRKRTPAQVLDRAREIALGEGLEFVYEGNVYSDGGNTYCPDCGRLLIERSWHEVVRLDLGPGHACPGCGRRIPMG